MERISLVPIGEIEQEVLMVLAAALPRTFGWPYILELPLPAPDYAFDHRRGQYRVEPILDRLRALPLESARVLGVVNVDLYTPGLNFIFGQATMGGRDALIALPRLRPTFYGLPDDPVLYHERVVKEAVHELGHTFGLPHCPDVLCVMHFSNTLSDTDTKGKEFCVHCRRRLIGRI
ncbi:MAG: archaemetzincin family Zn-dependent metalloprotease [Chloroflexi bacterium]|nr:archaemetzincin family Zn-dependent metalloprotease [Chloroflexota bacterium]